MLKPLRLAFVCHEYPPGPHGGLGTLTRLLGRGLAAAGHEVRIIGSYDPHYPGRDYEEDQGVRVWRLRGAVSRWGWLAARRRLFQQVAAWSRAGEIDAVEVPDWQGWAAGWPRLPIPVVVRLNGSSTYFAQEMGRSVNWRTRWFEGASYRRADFRCSASHYTARQSAHLFGSTPEPCTVLYNPVEQPVYADCPARRAGEVVFTGTLTAKKGVVSLLRAWPEVQRVHSSARLHVYGKDGRADEGGSMHAYLRSLLGPAQLDSVRFWGHQPREVVLGALARASVAVFPSYAEAFALAPLEAMACGCPTIYSRRGSGPELMEEGIHGLLIDPDQPRQIADAILRLLADTPAAARLGAAGRQRVQEAFGLARVVADNAAFYRDCIRRFASTPPGRRFARGTGCSVSPAHAVLPSSPPDASPDLPPAGRPRLSELTP